MFDLENWEGLYVNFALYLRHKLPPTGYQKVENNCFRYLILVWPMDMMNKWMERCCNFMFIVFMLYVDRRNSSILEIQWDLSVTTTSIIKLLLPVIYSVKCFNKTGCPNLFLPTISAFWSSSRWSLATKMSSRRQINISLGGRYRQVSLHCTVDIN